MQVNELKAQLKNGSLSGFYLLCGEEKFLSRHYLFEMRRVLLPDPGMAAFNHIVLEGEKIDYGAISDALASPPMMAEHKLIEWHLCDFSALREGDFEKLAALVEEGKRYPETVVCFLGDPDTLDVGSLPRRPSKVYKELSRLFSLVYFERSSESALLSWLSRHVAHEGLRASGATLSALLAQSGRSMDALSGEVAKLAAYVKANGREEITEEDVRLVASPSTESEDFGLSNAILAGKADGAYACLLDMKRRRVEPTLALSAVSRIYGDLLTVAELLADGMRPPEVAALLHMHEYRLSLYEKAAEQIGIPRLRQALSLCRRADIAAKNNTGADTYLTLELLFARMMGKKA